MANLKGGTFDKQIRDANFRLEARGTARHHNGDHKTHSNETSKKRDMYLKDFKNYLLKNGISEGKLNTHLGTSETMKDFLVQRINENDLSRKTAVDYVSGFSGMMKGLEESNVTINPAGREALEEARVIIKEIPKEDFRSGRAFENPQSVIDKIYDIRFEAGVLAQIQYETGFRISEAYELVQNPDRYINGNKVEGIVGKGNHQYYTKEISKDLAIKIGATDKNNIPTDKSYSSFIKEAAGNEKAIPHDFRLSYVKEQYEKKIDAGMAKKEALREVSREVNHYRAEITRYYLARA